MRWHPTKEEIQYWVEEKEHDFSLRETQGLRVNAKQWKDMYLYSDMHDIFFTEFPSLLHEWIKRKDTTNYLVWPLELVAWDEANLEELKVLDKKWTQTIDF
jgi:hypothetical protein